jgi:S1-C subfamily serine protease
LEHCAVNQDKNPLSRQPAAKLVLVLALGFLLGVLLLPWLQNWFYEIDTEPRLVTPRGELAAEEQSIIELFRESSPSVVYITTLTRQINPWTRYARDIPRGTGSGFIWDRQGHIVTNFHVLEGASSARITLHDHKTYPAILVGASAEYDLAVIRINAPARRLRPVPIGTSLDLHVGQRVFAIGNPFGLDQTLTTGIISALNRSIEGVGGLPIEGMVQTDAAINPGNSGGPLLDSAGRLIGVNTAIFSPSGAYAGIGFAVPVDTVNQVIPSIIAHGRYVRPQLGIIVDDAINRAITRQLGVQGLVVLDVRPGTAAASAGLRGTRQNLDGSIVPGDIIQQIDEQAISNTNDFLKTLDRHQPGDTVTLSILRNDNVQKIQVKLQ